MNKKYFLIILLFLMTVGVNAKRRSYRRAGVARTGAVLGNGVATMIKDLREKPQPLPKGYKREVDRPVVEEYTLWYKIKQGFKNFQYLAYTMCAAIALTALYKVYKVIHLAYLRYKISQLPPEEQEELLNYAMSLEDEPRIIQKQVACVSPEKTRELRLENDRKRKLMRR